jgi:hypothetical protein
MNFFNKVAILTVAATMMVAQVQAIELVEVETVAEFSITLAAEKSLADSMKLSTFSTMLATADINVPVTQISDKEVKSTRDFEKSLLIAE